MVILLLCRIFELHRLKEAEEFLQNKVKKTLILLPGYTIINLVMVMENIKTIIKIILLNENIIVTFI